MRPLLPGSMQFIVDPNAPGSLPAANAVAFADAAYNSWKVVGTFLISEASTEVGQALAPLAPGLQVKPNRVWYSPVRISKEFLFNSLCGRSGPSLPKSDIKLSGGRKARGEEWQRHAVAQFLAGRYAAELRPSADAVSYQGIVLDMPEIYKEATANEYAIIISAARAQGAKDAPDGAWDPGVTTKAERETRRLQASHPRNGAIPARLAYRELSGDMAPAGDPAATPVRDVVLPPVSDPNLFYRVRFTRTWQPVEDCSVRFPQQTVQLENAAGVNLGTRPLPAHGFLFLDEAYASTLPNPVRVRINGGMRWLLGSNQAWRQLGATNPVDVDVRSQTAHVVLRVPMTDAMFADNDFPQVPDASCTYLSMRRSVRALVDNRVTGGRLNFGPNRTSKETRDLMEAAFGSSELASTLSKNRPPPNDPPNQAAPLLLPILRVMFPTPTGQPGTPPGEIAYYIWQSAYGVTNGNPAYPAVHVGRGGPGAIVSLGLGNYLLNPQRTAGEGNDAFITRSHSALVQGLNLQPGAVFQLWLNLDEYERFIGGNGGEYDGHSLVFRRYGAPAAQPNDLRVVDQNGGDEPCSITRAPSLRIRWNGLNWRPAIWIAANWVE